MPTTYAQRLAEVDVLQGAGLGLLAYAESVKGDGSTNADVVWTKDPDHVVGTAGGKAPVTGYDGTETWVPWAGGDAQTAYGL